MTLARSSGGPSDISGQLNNILTLGRSICTSYITMEFQPHWLAGISDTTQPFFAHYFYPSTMCLSSFRVQCNGIVNSQKKRTAPKTAKAPAATPTAAKTRLWPPSHGNSPPPPYLTIPSVLLPPSCPLPPLFSIPKSFSFPKFFFKLHSLSP